MGEVAIEMEELISQGYDKKTAKEIAMKNAIARAQSKIVKSKPITKKE